MYYIEKIWKWYILYFNKISIYYKAVILILMLTMGIWLGICVYRHHMSVGKALVTEFLFCYLLLVFTSTVFARETVDVVRININIIHNYSFKLKYNIDTQFELLLNVLLLLPFGVLFPYVTKTKKVVHTFLAGLFLSITIEGLQFVLKKGTFELSDIINNSLGVLLGYLLYLLAKKSKRTIMKIHDKKENTHV